MTPTKPSPVKNDAAESTLKSVEASLMEALSLDETFEPAKPAQAEKLPEDAKPPQSSSLPTDNNDVDSVAIVEAADASRPTDEPPRATVEAEQLENTARESTADLSDLTLPTDPVIAKQEFTLEVPASDNDPKLTSTDSSQKSDQAFGQAALERLALSDSERPIAKAEPKLQPLEQSMLAGGMSRAELDAILAEGLPQPIAPAQTKGSDPSPAKSNESKRDTSKNANVAILTRVKASWKIQLASVTSMVLGFVASAIYNKPVVVVPDEPPVPPAVLYASINLHRNEPIQPIVPFDGLNAEVIQLGAKLFHDSGLSSNGKTSCASCHSIPGSGADNNALSMGVNEKAHRNTLSVFNSATNIAFDWDGEFETLEAQLESHVVQPWTLNSDWGRITKLLQANKLYDTGFKLYLRGEPNQRRAQEALAAYIQSLSTVGSNFDAWLQGEEQALSSDAIAGYHLFKKYNCVSCHQGANVGGTMFQSISKLEGLWPKNSQTASKEPDSGREMVTHVTRDNNVFRVPSLRNASRTAPYMHDGSVETLHQAIEMMLEGYAGVKPNAVDVHRIAAFIQALDGELRSDEFDRRILEQWKSRRDAAATENLDLTQFEDARQKSAE